MSSHLQISVRNCTQHKMSLVEQRKNIQFICNVYIILFNRAVERLQLTLWFSFDSKVTVLYDVHFDQTQFNCMTETRQKHSRIIF